MQLTSAQINISWFCDFHANPKTSCEYCWVTMAQSDRSRLLDHSAEEWLAAIRKNFPESTLIDFVGGEPTIFPRFHWLLSELSKTHRWSVTSNMGADRWKMYCEQPIPNCVSWTASFHHTTKDPLDEFAAKCLIAGRHYPLQVNLVEFPSYDAHECARQFEIRHLKVCVSPFEDVRDLNVAGQVPLTCNGGMAHVLLDPEGNIYKCLTQERRADRARWRLGNVFHGDIHWPKSRSICFIPCDQYYTLDQKHTTTDMWNLDVRALEVPANVNLEAHRQSFQVDASPLKDFIQLSQWDGNIVKQSRGNLLDSPEAVH